MRPFLVDQDEFRAVDEKVVGVFLLAGGFFHDAEFEAVHGRAVQRGFVAGQKYPSAVPRAETGAIFLQNGGVS